MKKAALKNGVKVIVYPTDSESVTIQATIKAGSNYESDKIRGISHFIEHLVFEGTKKRSGQEIASSIEGIGGEIGAFTTNTRTAYYVKVLKKHLKKAGDVLLDMIMNPVFKPDAIEKERKIIISEISMREDEPRSYQWELFHKKLYTRSNARYPTIGFRSTVASMTRKDIIKYFRKHYAGPNIILTAVGGITNTDTKELKKMFSRLPCGKPCELNSEEEPIQIDNRIIKEKKDTNHSYLVLGYNGLAMGKSDSYVLEVIQGILGRPLSGRLFRQIRQEKALCYDIGAHNETEIGYGFFAVYLSTDKNKLEKAEKLLLEQISKVDKVDVKELNEAKNYLEGDYLLSLEDSEKRADEIGFMEYAGNAGMIKEYAKKIRQVKKQDITRVKNKYFKNYTIAVIEQMR